MRRLAIDTSSVACTIALQLDGQLIERHEEQPREHTRLLLPMIREVLAEADAALRDLDAIVLGNGPGSFIGMRIAASVAQGLAYGAGLPIVPVSSLAAVAAEVLLEGDAVSVAVAQDAHMNEVYLGLYSRAAMNLPEPLCDERLHGQGLIPELQQQNAGSCVAAGQGWARYPQLFAANEAYFSATSGQPYPRARYLLGLSEGATGIAPEQVEPAYLRQKVAQKPSGT